MSPTLDAEMVEALDAVLIDDPAERAIAKRDLMQLNIALGTISAITILFLILAAVISAETLVSDDENAALAPGVVKVDWLEPVYLPRAEECIDTENGQDLPEYGIGYEPSLAIDSQGNMFITAHKDLRWGGERSPLPPPLGNDPGLWYACSQGDKTSWDYWASWFWISNDGGETWGPGADFNPTPGNMLQANYLAGGSECLGDEGDISVDANDRVYYLDTTLEDNWWHIFTDGGNTYEMNTCQRMNTQAGDDRPWVAAQADGIVHYLGNSGVPPPDCDIDTGRYWYYHSENGGTTFSQCYAMPGGWSTIASQRLGPHVYVAQEDADSNTGTVQVRISDDYGRGPPVGGSGSWSDPIPVGERNGNCPEGYPVVNVNEKGTVAVVWADCPNGGVGAWAMHFAVSYDNGTNWSTWETTPFERGISMYPFVSISEEDVISIAYYGLDYAQNDSLDNYTVGKEWYLYAGALHHPCPYTPVNSTPITGCDPQEDNDSWVWSIADPEPLHVVSQYDADNSDVHALHDFFETVISPEGDWLGIAYQQNIGLHPFEANEEQRYIKFVRGDLDV